MDGIRNCVCGVLVLVWGCTLLAACGGGGGGGGPETAAAPETGSVGRVAILLTDKPAEPFDEVNLTVTAVSLLGDEGPVAVFEDPAGETHNLLELRDSAELWFDVAEVPAGCYDKIRLGVTEVELVRYQRDGDGGVLYDGGGVPVPASGFPAAAKLASNKVDLNPRDPFCVEPGETLVLQLDLDAQESIHVAQTKGGREYNFRPVVFVTVLAGGGGDTGRLVRLSGWVQSVAEDRLSLCDATVGPLARSAAGEAGCGETVEVVVSPGSTSVFELDGTPFPADQELATEVFEGDFVRVIGRYTALTAPPDEWDEADRWLRRLDAEVVEVGVSPQTWSRYAGEITSGGVLDADCLGTFGLRLDPGQGISGNLDILAHLFRGSRVYSPDGAVLHCAALQVGTRVRVDSVLFRSDTPQDQLNAAVVVP
jgi:hypothetical protein